MIDLRAKHRLDSKAHIDYSVGLNVMGMRKQRTNIDQVRCSCGKIRDTFCMSVSLDRRIVSPNIPCIGHRQAYNELDMKYMLMGQHLIDSIQTN